MKPTKKPAKPRRKAPSTSPYGRLEDALSSTTSLAAGLAREAGERIRDLATRVTKSTDGSTRATDLLVHQHRRLEELFEHLESPKARFDATLRMLADDLAAHMAIEEKLFYPAVRKVDSEVILEGLEEHAMGRFALKRLLGTNTTHESLRSRLKALKELMTNHHAEEERELFPAVRRAMSNAALDKLGRSMKTRFDADVVRGHEAALKDFDDELRRPVRASSRAKPKRSKVAAKGGRSRRRG